MNTSRISPKLIVAILVAVIFGISLLFRIILPYQEAFNGEWIKFTSIDAYFHMRLVDNIAYNFPHFMTFDPYFAYPGGYHIPNFNFPDWLLAGIIWIFTLGSPTQHAINIIGPFFPAVTAALTVIPVFFIGKTLFNRWVGVLAAALMAILPGEYLGRTIIGLNDTPGIETLLSTTFLAFVILAVKSAREKGLDFDSILKRDWSRCLRPLVYSLLAGIFLGMYLISWIGALLFVFIFVLYLLFRFIKDHFKQQSVDYLAVIGFVTLLIAIIIFFPIAASNVYKIAMVLALFIPVVLVVISRLMAYRKIKSLFFPVTIAVIGAVAVAVFYAISPARFTTMFSLFRIFDPGGASATTTIEMQPFLAPAGIFTTAIGWGNFTTSFFLGPWWLILGLFVAALIGLFYRYSLKGGAEVSLLVFIVLSLVTLCVFSGFLANSGYVVNALAFPGLALISLSILIYLFLKKNGASSSYLRPAIWTLLVLLLIVFVLLLSGYGHRLWALAFTAVLLALLFIPEDGKKNWLLFLIWTLVILDLTLGQRRFAYYLVVNIALLSAYVSWQIIWLAGVKKLAAPPEGTLLPAPETRAKARKKRKRGERPGAPIYIAITAVTSLAVFFLTFSPNIIKAASMVTPEDAPYAPSDAWMASLTWLRDNTPEPMGDPDAYYRLYQPPPPGKTFTYPASAYGVTSWWDYGYWITRIAHRIPSANPAQQASRIRDVAGFFLSSDEDSARPFLEKMGTSYVVIDYLTTTSKYWAVVTWAAQPESQYYDIFYVPYQGSLRAATFYKPAYYQTLVVRLYNFDAKAVTNVNATVITYVEKKQQGITYKEVTDVKQFTSYQDALDYLGSLKSGNNIIIGVNPFVSPIPLEAVLDFRLIHSSEQGNTIQSAGFVPEVKIFEYTGGNK
jgi:oligosaccharyl transferase (archaeosortase A-associated)